MYPRSGRFGQIGYHYKLLDSAKMCAPVLKCHQLQGGGFAGQILPIFNFLAKLQAGIWLSRALSSSFSSCLARRGWRFDRTMAVSLWPHFLAHPVYTTLFRIRQPSTGIKRRQLKWEIKYKTLRCQMTEHLRWNVQKHQKNTITEKIHIY